MVSSKCLATNSEATYIRHSRVVKMMIRHQGMLRRLVKLGDFAPSTKGIGIPYLDHPSLYISSMEGMVCVIKIADAIANKDQKPAPLHANDFHKHTRAVLNKLHICYLEQKKEKFPTFALFLDATIQQTENVSP